MSVKFSRMKDGRLVRNLGYMPSGSQPKFYLGRDERDAILRVAQLEKFWDWWRSVCQEIGDPACWNDSTLAVAKAIADGRRSVEIDLDAPAEEAAGIISGMQSAVPNIVIRLTDEKQQKEGQEYWREEGNRLIEEGRMLLQHEGNERLHEAIDAYIGFVEEDKRLPSGKVTDWGQTKVRQIQFCRNHMPNVRLADLDSERIDELLGIIAKRPVSKKSREAISPVTARAHIKEFRQFLKWLNRSKQFCWKRPDDYEITPIRVRKSAEERGNRGALRVKTYSIEELTTLWNYATPWERCLIILALNCSFGMGEISTLRKDEILFRQSHPLARQLQIDSTDRDSWIRRIRTKTEVYGEWFIWPITVQAVEWLVAHRPKTDLPYLVTTKNGKALKEEGQRNNAIMNAWTRLTRRVKKDEPDFPKLSFNKLRKTASNMVRLHFGDELASLFLSHGSPVSDDDLLRNYTNERYSALHAAIKWLEEHLKPVFDDVDEPFPEKEKRGGANISKGTIQAIQKLHEAGVKPKEIAERLNVSLQTVSRWRKRAKK